MGLDFSEHPILQRYTASELRRSIADDYYVKQDQDWRPCVQGSDDACVRLAERRRVVEAIPAGNDARESLMRALLSLHGSRAVTAALTDSAGSVGERLARAAGVSEDSLVSEWRVWVLSRGRPQRVTAGLGDASVALLTVGALVALALRGAKWR